MYKQLAKYYDKIYSFKDYKTESVKIHSLIKKYKKSKGKEMLDVACGTGNHIQYLKKYYDITGLDLDKDMLSIAKKKYPGIKFHNRDMRRFDLKKKYDVIVCLFSAIAHLTNKADLKKAIRNFTKHLKDGGILIVEGFITPEVYKPNLVHAIYVNEPDLKIYRVNIPRKKGNIYHIDFHVMVADISGVKYLRENHKLAMHENKDFLDAISNTGLKAVYRKGGLMKGRGLYIGIKN